MLARRQCRTARGTPTRGIADKPEGSRCHRHGLGLLFRGVVLAHRAGRLRVASALLPDLRQAASQSRKTPGYLPAGVASAM